LLLSIYRFDLKAKDSEIDGVEFVERDEVLERLAHEESKAFFAEVF
jgi:putative (di)nucleoside polyphosphate hydrolase